MVLVPVVFPIAKEVGIHPVHFNIVLTAAVGIGLFLPPIGVGLLMALRFANISVGQHFKAYWPYLLALLAGLLLLIVFPGITLFLPRWAGGDQVARTTWPPTDQPGRRGCRAAHPGRRERVLVEDGGGMSVSLPSSRVLPCSSPQNGSYGHRIAADDAMATCPTSRA